MIKRIVGIILIIFIVINSIYTVSAADVFQQARDFLKNGQDRLNDKSFFGDVHLGDSSQAFLDLAGWFLGAGIVVIVVVLAIIGIKFMFANSEGKAVIKDSMVPYLIGAFIIVGAVTIWKIAISIMESAMQ